MNRRIYCRFLLSAIFCVSFSVVNYGQRDLSKSSIDTSQIVFRDTVFNFLIDSTSHNLGLIDRSQTRVIKHFKYIGTEPVKITRAWTGDPHYICQFPAETLLTNQIYSFTICFWLRDGYGKLSKNMGFDLSDGSRITLYFCGNYPPYDKNIELSKTENSINQDVKTTFATASDSLGKYGVQKFGKGTLHLYDPARDKYEFNINHNKLHNIYPGGVNDIFLWDTLTLANRSNEYIFSFKNDSKYPLFILDISTNCSNFLINDIGRKILLPDSTTAISLKPVNNSGGHFYGSVSIYYLRNGQYEYYDLGMWGFKPDENLPFARRQQQNRSDSIALFICDRNLTTLGDMTLKISHKDSVYFPLVRQINNEYVSYVTMKFNDTLWYEIRNEENLALSKGYIIRESLITNKFLWANDLRNEAHTYSDFSGPVKYKTLDGVYIIKWDKIFGREEVIEYLTSKGLAVHYSCEPYIVLSEKSKAIAVQNELIKSQYKIVLLPVIFHSHTNEFGWGGGCEYYDNVFSVEFYQNVTDDRIEAIFKQFAITEFESWGRNKHGQIRYKFTIKTIIDLQYMKILDNLWDLPEVYSLGQNVHTVAGLD